MEKALIKMARQLCAYDEASLMAMWDKYAAIVKDFEPSRKWEEAALVLGLIQALRWKNQLFNYRWAEASAPEPPEHPTPAPEPAAPEAAARPEPAAAPPRPDNAVAEAAVPTRGEESGGRKSKVLAFPTKKIGSEG